MISQSKKLLLASMKHQLFGLSKPKWTIFQQSLSTLSPIRSAQKSEQEESSVEYNGYMQQRKEILDFMKDYQVPMKFRQIMLGQRPIKDPQVAAVKNKRSSSNASSMACPPSKVGKDLNPPRPICKNYLQRLHRIVHSILYDSESQPWSSTSAWHVDHFQVDSKGHILVTWTHHAINPHPSSLLMLDNKDSSVEELKRIGSLFKSKLKTKLKVALHRVPKVTFQHKDLELEFFMQIVEYELEELEKETATTAPTTHSETSPSLQKIQQKINK